MNIAEYERMYAAENKHWWYVGLHELVLKQIEREAGRICRGAVIFDAGCGTGRLMELMASFGVVEGCDASAEAVRFCGNRRLSGVSQSDLNDISLNEERYDIITSIDVLYHIGIRDDVAVLRRLQTALKPGGLIIINLPALEFLRSSHDIAVHTRERYTKTSLSLKLAAAGFEVERISYRLLVLFPFIAAYRGFRRLTICDARTPASIDSDLDLVHPLVNAALLQVVRMENRMMDHCSLPAGSSLFVLARKLLT